MRAVVHQVLVREELTSTEFCEIGAALPAGVCYTSHMPQVQTAVDELPGLRFSDAGSSADSVRFGTDYSAKPLILEDSRLVDPAGPVFSSAPQAGVRIEWRDGHGGLGSHRPGAHYLRADGSPLFRFCLRRHFCDSPIGRISAAAVWSCPPIGGRRPARPASVEQSFPHTPSGGRLPEQAGLPPCLSDPHVCTPRRDARVLLWSQSGTGTRVTSIFVGNLSWTTSENEIRQAFERFGRVSSVRMATDKSTGRSRGFAFVQMPSLDDADEAIHRLNGSTVGGRALVVNEAHDKPRAAPSSMAAKWPFN